MDRHLVDRMLHGEERAFDEFFDAHFDRLFRFSVRRVGDAAAAEDVAQITLMQAMRKLHTWRGEAALFTWLCTICRHEIVAWTARHGRLPMEVGEDDAGMQAALDLVASSDESPDGVAERHELAARIQRVLDHLPNRYGDILEWKYLQEWPVSRVADKLGVSEKAAESMLTRAREAFRQGFASLSGVVSLLISLICLQMAIGCGSPTAPDEADTLHLGRSILTESFEFRHAAGDTVDAAWQEAFHQWAVRELGIAPTRRIVFNKYFSREHMRSQTGVGTANAYADPDRYELHTIWPIDNHEVIHLYASAWGRPVALWSEGLAVSYQVDPMKADLVPKWSKVPLHTRARQLRVAGRLRPIDDLLTSSGFRSGDPDVTYPEAGSFMLIVRSVCGLSGVRQLFATGNTNDTAASVRAQFQTACGRTINDIEHDWLALLESADGTGGER